MLKNLANAALFQCGWFACVLGGDSLWLLVGAAVLAVHLLWISSWAEDGALIIGVMNNGLTILGLSSFWQYVAKGVVIVLAVLLDKWRQKQNSSN